MKLGTRATRWWLSAAAALVVTLLSVVSWAFGTVRVKNTQPEEDDGRWKINMDIDYGSQPDMAYVPCVFEFTQTVHYERALTDESPKTPIERKIPLQNQQPINESLDLSFSDAMGKLYRQTKFNFKIRRDRGFEAGEYTLKIKRSSDGAAIGRPIKLVLKGENPIIDRRAIVFVADDKKKKKKKQEEETTSPPSSETDDLDDDDMDDPELEGVEAEPLGPPPEPPQQGGCGCEVAGKDGAPWGGLAGLMLLGAALARRRRSVA